VTRGDAKIQAPDAVARLPTHIQGTCGQGDTGTRGDAKIQAPDAVARLPTHIQGTRGQGDTVTRGLGKKSSFFSPSLAVYLTPMGILLLS
jgi:hypothetical protein